MINLSLLFSHLNLQSHHGAVELLPMKEELERATNAENIRSRRTQQCLRRVAEGLRAMPEMDTATAAALTPQVSSTVCSDITVVLVMAVMVVVVVVVLVMVFVVYSSFYELLDCFLYLLF